MSKQSSFLSKRAQESIFGSLPYYLRFFFELKDDTWSTDNPDGTLSMSVAENNLSVDLLLERMKKFNDIPPETLGYGDFGGEIPFKEAFIKLLNSTLLPESTLDHRKMVISTGTTAILESLSFSILDPGDGILLSAPFYAGYKFDLTYRAQGKYVPLHLKDEASLTKQLTEAKERSESEGTPIKGLIVTNPDNPTGIIYSETFLREAAEWCADNRIHLIASEVYANTVFYKEPVAFRSLFEIGQSLGREELKDRLHFVYGLSKDFCGSGLRIGIYYSESESICRFLSSSCVAVNPPRFLQHRLTQVLSDEAFVQSFIAENTKRVQQNYEILARALTEANISFVKPQGGIFVWIDLRKHLSTPDSRGEEHLCEELFKAGLLLSPGEPFSAPEPGFFRICYCTVPPSAIPVAVQRLRDFLNQQADRQIYQHHGLEP